MQYTKPRKSRKLTRGNTRGSIIEESQEDKTPYCITKEEFLIQDEIRHAYENDEREQELVETTTLDQLMQVLTNYCEENSTEDKNTTVSYIYELPDTLNLKKAIRIN